jgi:hypothetical protein
MPIPVVDLGPILANSATGPALLNNQLGPSALPLALFPVRLETRFFGNELRVRVYPDKVHIDSHDPKLNADEVAWGKRFWQLQWADASKQHDAWRMLADRFGAERGAWIARALTPTNLPTRPAGAPKYPDLGAPAKVTRIPKVRLLPDRWVATAFANGVAVAVVQGKDIKKDLAIGPDLDAAVTIKDDEPAIDDGMRWMIDFNAAEGAGMALRMTLPSPAVDVLLVTGVAAGDQSTAMTSQLDAHRYTDGLAFIPPASPSNNSAAGRTPYQEPDPQQNKSFVREWQSDKIAAGSNADAATKAFGVKAFARLASGDEHDDDAARAMATALWPATWGYFLAQMIGFEGTGLTLPGRDWARTHALQHVRPGGHLPAMRIGRQPYGVLPVTSLDSWKATDTAATRLRDVLRRLRDVVFRPAGKNVVRVGRTDSPGSDLVDVLQVGAVSSSYQARRMMGQHFLQHLRAFLGEDLDSVHFWQRLVQLTGAIPAQIGIGTPWLEHAAYDGSTRDITVPLVGTPSYIADLLAVTNPDGLANPIPNAAVPLLQALLRHALLREYTEAAARAIDPNNATLLHDAELVDLVRSPSPTPTWSRLRAQTVTGGVTAAQALATDARLAEFEQALKTLATKDVATLERHAAATLDATAYRLDAWVTSLAHRRLTEMRTSTPNGICVGGYGWVENIRPAAAARAVTVADEPGPIVAPANDPGFIHAPSLNQASAAALLRNAHLSHGAQADSPYAIELTSGRIRLAKDLFEGVRQGQPIGALLGYTFERNLHEAKLDDLIDVFRKIAPLPGAENRRIVVDGLALAAKWTADKNSVLPASDPHRAKAEKVLNALEVAVDAAADAVHAEGAFQMVRGNFARAAASLDAISSGQTAPPDLGFLATPRTGTGLTHRVGILLPVAASANPAGWGDRASSPRAQADTALDAWAGRLLGPGTSIATRVIVQGESAPRVVRLKDLGLTPIDFVWATEGADGIPRDISARILRVAGASSATINVSRAAGGMGDIIELATRLQRFLAGARPMDGADLMAPHATPARGLDLAEFETRVKAAEQALLAAHNALKQAVTSGTGIPDAMMRVAKFGVPGSIPQAGSEAIQARALLIETTRRTAPVAATTATDDDARRDALMKRLRTVFGNGFVALPRFTASNAADVEASIANAALGGDDALAAYTWMQRMERVRVPLARFARPMREAEVLGSGRIKLTIAQVPHAAGQRWVGLALAPNGALIDGAASLVLQDAPKKFNGKLCGLIADEWTELVPRRNETSGIAFQYNPPDSAAPQAILLAVPPVVGEPWTVGNLNRVLLETLDMLRIRAVDPTALGDAAHYLPATYLAFNANGDAVSTDLNPLAP